MTRRLRIIVDSFGDCVRHGSMQQETSEYPSGRTGLWANQGNKQISGDDPNTSRSTEKEMTFNPRQSSATNVLVFGDSCLPPDTI